MHVAGEAEVATEPVHEVVGRNHLHVGFVMLKDEFEASSDLLLRHGGDGDNLLEGSGHSFLATSDVEAGGGDGFVGTSFQVATVMNHFEETVNIIRLSLIEIFITNFLDIA